MPGVARPRWPPDSRRTCSSPTRTTWAGPTSPATAGYTGFNGLQLELRRRLSGGLQFQTSYAYGITQNSARYSFRVPRQEVRQSGGEGEVTHALKLNWVFELPFGQGKRWANQVNGLMDRIIGGWQIHGNMRVQSGRLVDFGNVRMVGFDEKELREDLYKLRIDDNRRVWMLPQAVVDETVKAFSVNATSPTGYGASGAPSGNTSRPRTGRTAWRRSATTTATAASAR